MNADFQKWVFNLPNVNLHFFLYKDFFKVLCWKKNNHCFYCFLIAKTRGTRRRNRTKIISPQIATWYEGKSSELLETQMTFIANVLIYRVVFIFSEGHSADFVAFTGCPSSFVEVIHWKKYNFWIYLFFQSCLILK